MTLPCCSSASVSRAALACSGIWGRRSNTTNEPLEQATSTPWAYWRLRTARTVRVSALQCESLAFMRFVSNDTAFDELLTSLGTSDDASASPLQQKMLRCAPSAQCRLSLEPTVGSSSLFRPWSVICLTPGAPGACVSSQACPSPPFTSIPTALRVEAASGL